MIRQVVIRQILDCPLTGLLFESFPLLCRFNRERVLPTIYEHPQPPCFMPGHFCGPGPQLSNRVAALAAMDSVVQHEALYARSSDAQPETGDAVAASVPVNVIWRFGQLNSLH